MIYGRLKFASSSLPATARHHGMPEPAQRRLFDHFCYFLGQNLGCFGIERPPYRGESVKNKISVWPVANGALCRAGNKTADEL